jgi:GntR family transcriptional regulator
LDRKAHAPLYSQLLNAILEIIKTQNLQPGDALPSENQLCREFGVSRTVVRQTLAQLENDGLVQRVKGKGTFVSIMKAPEHLGHTLLGLYEDAHLRGEAVRSKVLEHSVLEADAEIASKLSIEPGAKVVKLSRMRYVNEEPWALSTAWLPEQVGQYSFNADLTTESLYRLLERNGVIGVTGWRSVEAVLAERSVAKYLEVKPGSALLKLKSLRRDESGSPIEYFEAFHRGDRSRFEFELTHEQTQARVLPNVSENFSAAY